MSSSENARLHSLLSGMMIAALLLSGCQVKPLYSAGPSGAPAPALAAIEISDAGDRVEQQVRNSLIFLLAGGKGEPATPQYNLFLDVTNRTTGVLYDRGADRETDTANAGRVVVRADYNLIRTDTGLTIQSGNRSAVALVDFSVQEFARLRAIRDAQNRAARELAEVIRADLAGALARDGR